MLIPLSDPIWTRLYGAYGLEDVAGILRDLSEDWDEETAQDLYCEKLHHQEDLYPATFAALPWIWKIAPRPLKAEGETAFFLSHVLDCATRPGGTGPRGDGPRGLYRGLVTDVGAHQLEWIPAEQRLRAGDMPVLKQLEDWFTQAAPKIAEACVKLVAGDDRYLDANLLRGPAALAKGLSLPRALTMWGDEESRLTILREAPPKTADDRSAAQDLAARVAARSPDLAQFLREWAAA